MRCDRNIWFLFILLAFTSCVKKKGLIAPTDSDCFNFSGSGNLVNWPGIDTVYNTPSFNPNNSNEIIYVRGIISANKSYLVKKNLITNSETVVISDIWSKPDWSIKDWIVFNHADNQVWKIKSNGDSLTLLTPTLEGGHNSIWSPDGNKIAFIKEIGSIKYPIIADGLGNHLDTLTYFQFYFNDWSSNGIYICAPSNATVKYQNVQTNQVFDAAGISADPQGSNNVFINGVSWTPDSQYLVWSNRHGIYKTNISNNETIKIKNSCDSKYYTSVSVSPDGKKIIAERIEQSLNGNNLYIKSGLSLIDLENGNEIKIK